MDKIKQFAAMLHESSNVVFFGGAGVSTESGVKDYRSADGIYNAVKDYGVSPEVILSHDFFMEHPDVFYRFYAEYFLNLSAKPNAAHKAIAELETMGKIHAVITQNIDELHQAAGSRKVLELHGTTQKYHCIHCRKPYPCASVEEQNGNVSYCPFCGGLIRPEVTLYGEMLNRAVEERAIQALEEADMLIVGGTSLVVYPAAAYLNFFKGQRVVVINRDETFMDAKASLVFHENIGSVFEKVMPLVRSRLQIG